MLCVSLISLTVFVSGITATCETFKDANMATYKSTNCAKGAPNLSGCALLQGTFFSDKNGLTFPNSRFSSAEFVPTAMGGPKIRTTLTPTSGSDVTNDFVCTPCGCTENPGSECPAVTTSTSCPNGYVIIKNGYDLCIKFGNIVKLPVSTAGRALPSPALSVTIGSGYPETALRGDYATDASGNLVGLSLEFPTRFFAFLACGLVVDVQKSSRKRAGSSVVAGGAGVFQASAIADPHFEGGNGVAYDFEGKPGAAYALFTTPAFEVNMLLSAVGPKVRYMTKLAVLYRGATITIDPWTAKNDAAALTSQLAALNATVKLSESGMTIAFCESHVVTINGRHISTKLGRTVDYLDFTVSVPGCHDAYDGALGHTYQCAYTTGNKTFEWSREREESFRIASLTTPSGSYTKDAECAREDEFGSAKLEGKMTI